MESDPAGAGRHARESASATLTDWHRHEQLAGTQEFVVFLLLVVVGLAVAGDLLTVGVLIAVLTGHV